jgi:serine O-acetyltransferase
MDDKKTTDAASDTEYLTSLVSELLATDGVIDSHASGLSDCHPRPSRDKIIEIVKALHAVLYPGYFGSSELTADTVGFHIGSKLDWIQRELRVQIERGLSFTCNEECGDQKKDECEAKPEQLTKRFLSRLPEIRRILATDIRAAYEGDPAATSPDEAIFCYPGIHAVTNYRLAHELQLMAVPLIPRIITEYAHSITGIDIHPGATIGESFFIDHGTGVVIGETTTIGKHVQLYQGVTLGAKSFPLDENGNPIKGIKRHPNVEDGVVIYSEATILGPITIGRDSVIGGNVWLVRSVPPGSRITQAQTRQEKFVDGGGI